MRTAEHFYTLGWDYRNKDPKKAIKNYKRAIKLDPKHTDAYNGWGNALLLLGDTEGAKKKYLKSISIDPHFHFGYFNLGIIHQTSDPERALDYFEKTIQVNPSYAFAHFRAGSVLLDLKKNEEAIPKLEKYVALEPNDKFGYYNLGRAYRKADPEKAIENYKKAVAIDPDYTDAHLGWGNVLSDQKNQKAATAKYEKCIKIDPKYFWAYYNLGRICEKKSPEKAMDYYKKTIELNKNYRSAYNSLGSLLFNQKKYKEALKQFQKTVQIDPNFYSGYFNQGRCYRMIDLEKAPKQYQKAIEIKPNDVDAYNNLGNVMYDLDKVDKAIAYYEKCLEIDANYTLAHTNLARVYERTEPKKALEYYQMAVTKDPDSIDVFINWGNFHLDCKEYDKAREKYLRCIEIDKNSLTAHRNLGISYLQTDPEAAIPLFKKVIEEEPDNYQGYSDLYFCITLIKKNKNHIKKFKDLVEENATASAYHALGNLYQYHLKDYEQALVNYNKSLEVGGSVDLCLDISNVHDSKSNLEKALEELYKKDDNTSNKIYPKHNEAHYLFKMGHYEKSRDLWEEVLADYEKALK